MVTLSATRMILFCERNNAKIMNANVEEEIHLYIYISKIDILIAEMGAKRNLKLFSHHI